jgi:hypothetical protein
MPDAFVRAGEVPAIVAPIEIVTTSAAPFATMRHFISLLYRDWFFGFADSQPTYQLFIVKLNKNALARTHFSCLHYSKLIALLHDCEASRTTGIVECNSAFSYVGNAIFELHKCIWTMIDTQPVARTKVLINPNSHGLNDRGNE